MSTYVLVVEDNEALADNIAELFADDGHRVTVCRTADAALEHTASSGFDVAVVDIRLPGSGDGLALVPRLKERCPGGEVILVTGNATLDSAIAAVRHGAFAYLLKPFDPEELSTLGQRAMAQVQLRRERERLARELATSEALHRSVVEHVEAAIAMLEADGTVQFWNRFAAQVTGWPPEQAHGRLFHEMCADESERESLLHTVAEGSQGTVYDREIPMHTKEGHPRVIRWTFTSVPRDSGQTPSAVLALGLDITERRELERRFAENEAMAAMGRLTTGIAHEIRNPLNAAKLQLELLMRGARKLGGQTEEHRLAERAEIVRLELARLSQLLEDFLGLARSKAIERAPLELGPVIEEVVRLQEPVAQSHGLQLWHQVSETAPVLADRERVKQVLINLIGNAIEATQGVPDGRIDVLVSPRDEDFVEISVTDTGPGIDPGVWDQLFHPFVTTKPAGTGLGLTVVKRIIELHGGNVELAPRETGGTVARFTLPTRDKPGTG